ncbi:MAG: lysophospholipid acyltransferase family protein [Candidatus Coatesbacteria bacterium]
MKPVLHALRSVANAVAPTLGAAFIRLWGLTLRPRVAGRWHWRENRGVPASAVLAFWHDQLLIMCVSLIGRRFPYGVLVSRHPDAEAMARAVTKLGLHVIRGSSTSGGVRALAEMAAEIRSGRIMIVTPDGPKGPRHRAGDGALVLARRAGAPIIPVGGAAAWRIRAGSWDRLQFPVPFCRVEIVEGDPIRLEAGRDAGAHERDRLKLEMVLRELTAEAGRRVGR